jgi:nitric oxide-associated protein 1
MLYTLHNILRLCRRQCFHQKNRIIQVRAINELNENKVQPKKHDKSKDLQTLLQYYGDKITFNSYLEHEKLQLGYFKYHLKTLKKIKFEQKKQFLAKSLPPLPVALQYHVDKDRLLSTSIDPSADNKDDEIVQLPFANNTNIEIDTHEQLPESINLSGEKSEFNKSDINKWMANYEYFDDSELDVDLDDWSKKYGTPDPSVGISRVPCGGCGALLHCSEPSIPGYLPSEIFRDRSNAELKTIECQRCHFLKEYNIALDVSVQPEEYEKLLQSIRLISIN